MAILPNEEIIPTPFIGGGMSGPEHYETAEELLQYASDEADDYRMADLRIKAALALAAATALSAPIANVDNNGMAENDAIAWYAAASVDSVSS